MTFRRLPCPVTPNTNFNISGFYGGTLLFFLSVAAVFVGGASAWALTISPPLYEIGATPGQNLTTSLKVFNETESDSTWYFSTENFTSQGEQGEPKFYAGGTSNTFDLASWIIAPRAPITIKSGETRQVEFIIEVPKDAEPGGHYAAVFLNSAPPSSEGGTVGIASRIGTLVLLRVEGDITEQGDLREFTTAGSQSIFGALPIDFYMRFENSGSVHLKPFGEIGITNIFGIPVAAVLMNQGKQPDGQIAPVGNVLPKSTRKFDARWQKSEDATKPAGFLEQLDYERRNFALGLYTATLNLEYGTNGETATSQTSFWVLPWRVILVYGAIGAIILALLFFGVRRYNEWIIKRAKRA